MFLEAQFGADNVSPISIPKLPKQALEDGETDSAMKDEDGTPEGSEDEEQELEAATKRELERLHKIGIPVPGVEIRVDKIVAKVWLEDLEIECASRVLGERVRTVVERAVEVTAPLWA